MTARCTFAVACGSLSGMACRFAPAWADDAVQRDSLVQQLNSIDTGTLSVMMIFGTGLVACLCWGIGWIVACFRGDAHGLRSELDALHDRVARVEQSLDVVQAEREAAHSEQG